MNSIQLTQQANAIADEEVTNAIVLGFLNDAVARINVKCNTNFPFFSENKVNDDYIGFPETWQRALLVPFAVGRIKQTDSSQFEYSDAYGEFTDNLIEFKSKYAVPIEYKASNVVTSVPADLTGSLWGW